MQNGSCQNVPEVPESLRSVFVVLITGRGAATAQAAAKCELLIIKRESFRQLLDKDRDLAYIVLWNVLQQVLERLRATNDKVMMFLAAPVLT